MFRSSFEKVWAEEQQRRTAIAKDRESTGAHALASGFTEGVRKYPPDDDDERDLTSEDKPRDLNRQDPEVEKGNKKRLAEFYDRLGQLEYRHDELVHSLNPSHAHHDSGEDTVLPAGQMDVPEPCEMVGVPDEAVKAYRDAVPVGPEHLPERFPPAQVPDNRERFRNPDLALTSVKARMEARRDPGENLPGPPGEMRSPDPKPRSTDR